jgi:hypothetical protein
MGIPPNDVTVYRGKVPGEDDWIMSCCPLAAATHSEGVDEKPSFGIHIKNEAKICNYNCFTCGSGTLGDLICRYNFLIKYVPEVNALYLNLYHDILGEKDRPPVEFNDKWARQVVKEKGRNIPVQILKQNPLLNKKSIGECAVRARKWLFNRGISEAVYTQYSVCHNSRGDVVFPIIDEGKVWDMHCRLWDRKQFYHINSEEETYGKEDVWFGIQFFDVTKPVILVESQTDLLRIKTLAPELQVLACCGSVSKEQLNRLHNAVKYLGFDADRPGRKYVIKAVRQLYEESYKMYFLDWNVVGVKDAGELQNKQQLKEVLLKRKLITYTNGRIFY